LSSVLDFWLDLFGLFSLFQGLGLESSAPIASPQALLQTHHTSPASPAPQFINVKGIHFALPEARIRELPSTCTCGQELGILELKTTLQTVHFFEDIQTK